LLTGILRRACGPFFMAAGALHYILSRPYESIVPDYLPRRRALVMASGAAELAGGAALLHPATRRAAGWWLIATLLAIFPANVWMAQHPEGYRVPGGRATLLARLPLQAALIAWVRAAARL
jgi:uncharacterized membrane protein